LDSEVKTLCLGPVVHVKVGGGIVVSSFQYRSRVL